MTLDEVRSGQTVRVLALTTSGAQRRRLMDLGLVPGCEVQAELRSPLGDPTAYRVLGSLIVLREQQARQVTVEPGEASDARG